MQIEQSKSPERPSKRTHHKIMRLREEVIKQRNLSNDKPPSDYGCKNEDEDEKRGRQLPKLHLN
jgi:hypothetical protein